MTPRPAPRAVVGVVFLVLTALATLAATLLDLRVPGSARTALDIDPGWTAGVPGIALAWAGLLVLQDDGRNRLGWALSGMGLWWAVDGLAGSWLTYATLDQPPLPGASASFFVYQRLGAGLLLVFPLVLLLFPDGRLPSGWLRGLAWAALALMGLLPVVLVAVPSDIAEAFAGDGRLPAAVRGLELDLVSVPLSDALWRVLLTAAYLGIAVSLVPALAALVVRHRRATGRMRVRMRWLLWAGVADVLVMLTARLLPGSWDSAGLDTAVVLTAAAAAAGATRPDLVDVDRLLGATLLYGALLVATLGLDVLVIGLAGRVLGGRVDGDQTLMVAVFVVAVLYAPLRDRLSRLVRRWVVGERERPYAVVSRLAQRLEESTDPDAQLVEVARTVATAFRSSYVGVEVRQRSGDVLLAEHGDRPGRTRSLPITYRDEQIGRLLLSDRDRTPSLRPRDEQLLADVVRQAAAAARSARLNDELQDSRERLVTAVEDERRRLRRDLHDGLGPTLAGVASRIDLARIVVTKDPAAAQEALASAREEVGSMLREVRRLVHGLRPPALDQVGLVRALRQQAERAAPGLSVTVTAEDLPELRAAVEVAAYRIVSEALTNVVKHAGATAVTVRLAAAQRDLVVEVVDDGIGIGAGTPAGVGLVSLRERAEELGGRCSVLPAGPGTLVRATLPLGTPPSGRAAPTLSAPGSGSAEEVSV